MTVSRRSKRDQGPGVSLFPFLAVLLCTMGMLIMLLVLISRDTADQDAGEVVAQSQTEEEDLFSEEALNEFGELSASRTNFAPIEPSIESSSPPSSPPPEITSVTQNESPENKSDEDALYEEYLKLYGEMTPEEIESQRESAEWFLSELKGVRDRTEGELATQRTKLAEAESAIGKMVNQLIELNAQALSLTKDPSAEDSEEASIQAEIEKKAQEIADLNVEIENLRQKAEESGKKPTYAILPYRGKSGTFRRPIYVECDGNGIRLMPENIPFLPEDFLVARYPGNPFDAGLRAARQYYVEKGEGDAQNEPYPLLILRPEAAQKYYVAKAALASWGGEFGYEFVESDSSIEYPKPDAELRKRVEEQIAMARMRLAGPLAALMNELEANGQLGPNVGLSDEVREENDLTDGDPVSLAGGDGNNDKNGGGLASRLGPYARIDESVVQNEGMTDEGRSVVDNAGGETAVPFQAVTGHSDMAVIDGEEAFPLLDDYEPAPTDDGYAGQNDSVGTLTQNAFSDSETNQNPEEKDSSEFASNLTKDEPVSEQTTFPPPLETTPEFLETARQEETSAVEKRHPLTGERSSYIQGTTPYSATESGVITPFAESSAQTEKDKASFSETTIDPRQTVGNTAFLQGNKGETTPGADLGVTAPDSVSEKVDPKKKSKESKVKSEREKRAINLAEEFRKPSQMAIERPITLECHADKIIFVSQAGLREAHSVPYGPDSGDDQTVLETVVFCVRSWNVAGRNMFWSPWIKAKVAPGGEETFKRLARLMTSQKVRMDRVP